MPEARRRPRTAVTALALTTLFALLASTLQAQVRVPPRQRTPPAAPGEPSIRLVSGTPACGGAPLLDFEACAVAACRGDDPPREPLGRLLDAITREAERRTQASCAADDCRRAVAREVSNHWECQGPRRLCVRRTVRVQCARGAAEPGSAPAGGQDRAPQRVPPREAPRRVAPPDAPPPSRVPPGVLGPGRADPAPPTGGVSGGAGTTGPARPPTAGGGVKTPGEQDYLLRFACCDGLTVRSEPRTNGPIVETLGQGQQVWLTDLYPRQALSSLLAGAGPNTTVWSLLNDSNALYFAQVFVPKTGKTGYAPLYQLFLEAPKGVEDSLRIEVGFGRVARELNKALTKAATPDHCDDPIDTHDATAGEDLFQVNPDADAVPCRDDNTCQWCLTEVFPNPGQYKLSPREQCEQGPVPTDCKSFDPTSMWAFCKERHIPRGTRYRQWNRRAYRCGEYPFGETNTSIFHDDRDYFASHKLLYAFSLWGMRHEVMLGRLDQQRAIAFDTFNLTTKDVERITAGRGFSAKNVWIAMTPATFYDPAEKRQEMVLSLGVCAHAPGTRVSLGRVAYDARKTPKDAFEAIEWGRVDFDRLDLCALGRVRLDGNWRPRVEWLKVSEFRLAGANVSDAGKVDWAPWVDAVQAVSFLGAGVLGPILGGIVRAVVVVALAAEVAVPLVIDATNDDEWAIDRVVEAVGEAKLQGTLLGVLNDATRTQLDGAVPNLRQRAADVCDQAFPTPPGLDSPFRYLYSQCQQMTDHLRLDPFQLHQPSLQQGCYGTDHFFSPHDKTQPSSSPWWYQFAGQSWYTGVTNQDLGCRVGFDLRVRVDQYLWPSLRCLMAEGNLALNNDLTRAQFLTNVQANCRAAGLRMIRDYFGTGADLRDLIEKKGLGTLR